MLQAINLGTPNNNDGDSLYAGGTKINENFVELYEALAGSTSNSLRIDLEDVGLVRGNALQYQSSTGRFISASSTALRTLGPGAASLFYLTNNAGQAGADGDIQCAPNHAVLMMNGRVMWNTRLRTTSTTTATRGELHMGMGNANVTSISIYTSSVVVRGVNGLEVYVATAEDTAAYQTMLTTSSNGIRLYQSPVLDVASGATKAISDSSNSIAHTGFVKTLTNYYALSSTTITVNNGLVGAGAMTANRNIGIDPVYYPTLCQGFLYSYSSVAATLTVTPGVATHYSYAAAGVTPISNTSVLSIIATTAALTKTWATGWTPLGSNAIVDATSSISTWYYIYLVANTAGTPDIVVSSQKTITGANSAVNAVDPTWAVVRRLGVLKTNTSAAPTPLPFRVTRLDNTNIKFSWGRLRGTGAVNPGTGASHAAYRTVLTGQTPANTSTAATSTADSFIRTNLPWVPPLPGITMDAELVWTPTMSSSRWYAMNLYGQQMNHSSIATNVNAGLPTVIAYSSGVNGVTGVTTLAGFPMSPDREFVTDTVLGDTTVFPNTGLDLRHYLTNAVIATTAAPQGQTYVAMEVLGFNVAR